MPLTSPGLQRTLAALGDVFHVRFEGRTLGDDAGLDAWFLREVDPETMRRIALSQCPCYAVVRDSQRMPCGEAPLIKFSRHPVLPPALGGRQVETDEAAALKSLPKYTENMIALATKAGAPVWAMQEVEGRRNYYVSGEVPELNEGEPLFSYFHGSRFLLLLPLILFLRDLTNDHRWEQPPLQACFMFDDPNLHWPTYGFIDFAQIAAHAQKHNYHVCFATIPQDTWFVHMPTALLFQEHRDQVSLLIHGNDHIAQELARPFSDEERKGNLVQALRRIGMFERRSGVEVAKVMVPPHGACSENTLGEMAELGFEAACISQGSLRRYNADAAWVRTVGMRPSDVIGNLPVFPRFPLTGSCRNNILLAALLNQPIIARGHHHDIAEGLQLLADVSEFVNSLGPVRWTDMKRISRSHYARRVEGDVLRVKMFTKRIEVCAPEGTNQILVERPWLQKTDSTPLAWRLQDDRSTWKLSGADEPIPLLPGQKIDIVSELPASPLVHADKVRGFRLWPVMRRQFTEARDRLAPLLNRVAHASVKPQLNK